MAKVTAPMARRMMRLRNEGYLLREIAEEMGVSVVTVLRHTDREMAERMKERNRQWYATAGKDQKADRRALKRRRDVRSSAMIEGGCF